MIGMLKFTFYNSGTCWRTEMRSPFPGMDPYIETRETWTDFHADLAPEIQEQLNRVIQPRYVARLNATVTYEAVEIAQTRGVRPDVSVWHRQDAPSAAMPRDAAIAIAPVESLIAQEFPLRLLAVEVRKVETMELVTAIDILSPVNKRPDHDAYKEYNRKRRELLRSSAHVLEIDLLRGGERPPLEAAVPEASYYVMLSRADRRPRVQVWPIQLREPLPTVPVPLLEPDPDAALALNVAVESVYERGGYSVIIDYLRPPPPPPLAEADARWLHERLVAEKRR